MGVNARTLVAAASHQCPSQPRAVTSLTVITAAVCVRIKKNRVGNGLVALRVPLNGLAVTTTDKILLEKATRHISGNLLCPVKQVLH